MGPKPNQSGIIGRQTNFRESLNYALVCKAYKSIFQIDLKFSFERYFATIN